VKKNHHGRVLPRNHSEALHQREIAGSLAGLGKIRGAIRALPGIRQGVGVIIISGTGRSNRGTGTLPGTKTLPGRRDLVNSSGEGRRGASMTRRRPKKTREKTPRIGIAAKFVENGTISNEMINSATDKAGASRPSVQSGKEKIVSRSRSRKRVNQSRGAAREITR
jgi:hypothetical protein